MFVSNYWVCGRPTERERKLLELDERQQVGHEYAALISVLCFILAATLTAAALLDSVLVPEINAHYTRTILLVGGVAAIVPGMVFLCFKSIHRRQVRDVRRLKASPHVHHRDSLAFSQLREAVKKDDVLLKLNASTVDDYLYDEHVIEWVALLENGSPAPSDEDEARLKAALKAKAESTAEVLHQLDKSSRDELSANIERALKAYEQ